ncbi:hypothetical protein INR49_017092 [Caranx melampygus]|nr:hypothetical protein INR49_017092 [Caranx melampygus]
MGRYLSTNMCSSSVTRNLRSYCKIRYLMSLIRRHPCLAKEPLCLDAPRYSQLSAPPLSRFTRKATFKTLKRSNTSSTSYHVLRDLTQEVKHFQVVRLYSSSNRDVFKTKAPVGIIEDGQTSFHWTSLGEHLGQSFNRLSRHINIYFKSKDVVPLTENATLVVATPEYLGRAQKRGHGQRATRERNVSESNDTMQVCNSKDRQESSGASLSTHEMSRVSGVQLFHISSLATRFGEGYSYVAGHINSVFSRGFEKVEQQENVQTMSSTRGTQRRQKRKKIQNTCIVTSKEAEIPQVKPSAESTVAESNNLYNHFARHINRYFGAKVTDEVQNRREHLPVNKNSTSKNYSSTKSVSPTQGATSQQKQEEPIVPEGGGLFHSSHVTTNFGENHFQMASHINQYFKGQSGPDEDAVRNLLIKMDPGSATSEGFRTMTFMDCLRHPTTAIPDLVGSYLKLSSLSQKSKPKPATTSPAAILSKKFVVSRRQAEEITRGLISNLGLASSPGALIACVEALNEHLIRYPSCKALTWQEKIAVTLLRKRRTFRDDQVLQSAIRETLALIGYVDPVKGCGIRVLSIDGGGTRGVVPLQVLKLLEDETGKKIHQLFDYICGVSTGAVLAFMLGLARFSLEECADMYRRFGSEVFRQNPLVGTVKMGWSHSYYNTETWETILQEKLGNRVLIKTAREESSPKVSAVSAVVNWGTTPKAFVFRNYNHKPGSLSRYAGDSAYQMWEADGGILLNNPCALAVHESRLLWPNQPFQCVLSLGTGRYDNAKRGPATSTSLRAKISNLICSATDTEGVHTLLDDLLAPDVYFRFNPMLSGEVSLDESRPGPLEQLQRDTQTYLERNRLKLARLCLVLGAEPSALSRTKYWKQLCDRECAFVPASVKIQVRQPPTIIKQSMKEHIVDPKDTMVIECEAKGNPHPIFSWRRNGKYFNIARDPQASMRRRSGTLDIYARRNPEQYEAEFQCIASNEYGAAYSNKILVRLYRPPMWPKEILEPVVVSAGLPLVLSCDPPPGPPKPETYWMLICETFQLANSDSFPTTQAVRQDRRVSMGINGDLYFSNVLVNDSATDYCCNARLPHKNVIQQKMPVVVKVITTRTVAEAAPTWLSPTGSSSSILVLQGEELLLECIAAGVPTPHITWTKDGDNLVVTPRMKVKNFNKMIQIPKATFDDAGEYVCTATNKISYIEHTITVRVKGALPQPNRQVSGDTLSFRSVTVENTAVYQCNASNQFGYLLANAFVNVLLPELRWSRYGQGNLEGNRFRTFSNGTLEIKRTQMEDQGTYSCVVSNIAGRDETQVRIEVKDFLVQYDDDDWLPGKWKNLSTYPGNLNSVILHLIPFTYYEFRVIAINEIGPSRPSRPSLRFQTSGAHVIPKNVKGVGTWRNNMEISWEPLSYREWNGPHLKYLVWWRRRDSREEWKNATTKWLKYYIYDADTFTPYDIKVQAVNDFGLGPSLLLSLVTLEKTVYYWRDSSQLRWHRVNRGMKSQSFPNNVAEPSGVVTELIPYSNYKMYIVVANNRYEGPPSNSIHFSTPEGVPSAPKSFRIQQRHLDSIYVDWDVPAEPNGIITGYSLKYQTVNATRGEELQVEEFPPNVTSFSVRRYDRYTRYRFSVAARTRIGRGEWHTEESPHYTTEIYAQDQVDISTQGWFIGIMCAVALIVIILLVVCFIKRSRGGKYPVREKKDISLEPVDDKEQEGSFDYREEERGLQRGQPSMEAMMKRSDSDDSLVDYGEGGEMPFNEDGSFIGQYTGTRRDVRDLDFGGGLELHSPMNTIYSLA